MMQKILFYLVRSLLRLLSLLPIQLLYAFSTFLYVIAYYVIGYRKRVIYGNLLLVFPEKSKAERTQIAKKFYRHLCDLFFETIKAFSISEAEIRKRFVVQNMEVLNELYQQDRSVLILSGHYGNWEWNSFITLFMPYKGFAVYKKLNNSYFDALVKKSRERFGATLVTNKKIPLVLFRNSKKGLKTLTYVLSDQTPNTGKSKFRAPFMGIDVPIFTGTEELAKKLDFSVVYLHLDKVKRGHYEASFVLLAEDPKKFPDFEITRLFLKEMEKQIHEKPEYYLWSHKRWKHRKKP